MNSESEGFLEQLRPRGAPPPLRERVLDGVRRELAAQPRARWPRLAGIGLAASVLVGVALNLRLDKAQEARLAEIYGPEPVPYQLAQLTRTLADVAGEQTASWFRQELLRAVPRRSALSRDRENYWIDYYSKILGKERPHEKAAQEPENHRHRGRGPGSALPARQRRLDLDHGLSA